MIFNILDYDFPNANKEMHSEIPPSAGHTSAFGRAWSNTNPEVLKLMGTKSGNYSVYRDRLIKRGVILAKQGYIRLNPPFFAEYIKNYGMSEMFY